MKKLVLLTCALVVSFMSYAQNDSTSTKTLPDIQLKDMDGNAVSIKDFGTNGKITVFSFWATWCGPCKKELKNMSDFQEEWAEEYNVEIVAVCTDNSRNVVKVKPFVNGQGWEYKVLMDTNQDFQRAMNAPNIPFTVIVDASGNVVYTHLGYVEGDEYELDEKLKKLAGK